MNNLKGYRSMLCGITGIIVSFCCLFGIITREQFEIIISILGFGGMIFLRSAIKNQRFQIDVRHPWTNSITKNDNSGGEGCY